jgi:hypothetical protein
MNGYEEIYHEANQRFVHEQHERGGECHREIRLISREEIYRYMGYKGEPDAQMEALVAASLEKLEAVSAPIHVRALLPCAVS